MRCPSTSFGPVHPLGVRSTIIGHRGRSTSSASSPAARSLMSAISSSTSSSSAANRAWTETASSSSKPAVKTYEWWPYPRMRSVSSSSPMRASTVGLAIL